MHHLPPQKIVCINSISLPQLLIQKTKTWIKKDPNVERSFLYGP